MNINYWEDFNGEKVEQYVWKTSEKKVKKTKKKNRRKRRKRKKRKDELSYSSTLTFSLRRIGLMVYFASTSLSLQSHLSPLSLL